MPAEHRSSRLLNKIASAIDEFGVHQFEGHLDSLISKKDIALSISGNKNRYADCIVKIVARELKISPEELKFGGGRGSKATGGEACFGLNISFYLIKNKVLPMWTNQEIAEYFMRRSHASVSRAIKSIQELNPNNKFDKPKHLLVMTLSEMVDKAFDKMKINGNSKINGNGNQG